MADFRFDETEIVLDIPDRLILVPDFPHEDGDYMPHAGTGVPHGRMMTPETPGSRHLSRLNGRYAGFLARSTIMPRDVDATTKVAEMPGVVAEVREKDVVAIRNFLTL